MANLTPDQIKAAQNRGAVTEIKPKQVSVTGFERLAHELRKITEANARSNEDVVNAIGSLIQMIASKETKDLDISGLTKAIESLKQDRAPVDYEMTFERDNRGTLKSGVRFTEIKRDLH